MEHSEPDTTQTHEEPRSSLSDIAPGEIVIGTLVGIDKQGQPLVDFPESAQDQPLKAVATLALTQTHIGRQVALLFANGNLQKPVVMGMIHSPLQDMLENFTQPQTEKDTENEARNVVAQDAQEDNLKIDDVLVDGKKIVFEAKEKIVLKCGESSITLTQSGEVLIRGKYLLNRSTGVNRIMGGSVQVN